MKRAGDQVRAAHLTTRQPSCWTVQFLLGKRWATVDGSAP